MAMNPWVGWSISTLALYFLNGNSSSDSADTEPEKLSVTETKTGTPIPVIIGRVLIKQPLTIFYGDFRADRYTETYSAHAEFSAWPIILTMLLEWLTMPVTGKTDPSSDSLLPLHTHPVVGPASIPIPSGKHSHLAKEVAGPNYLMALATWLLGWLINGRNLKTTMQKGFKYYMGYQQLICWSNEGMRIRSFWMGTTKAWEGDEAVEAHTPNAFSIHIDNDELFGGVDENGGFTGDIHMYMGGRNQIADPWMVQQMGADSVQAELRGLTPAYRPYVSLVVPTAYVGKQATIPETWIEMQFVPNRLGLGAIGDDANPAEVLYEIHKNINWGLGQSDETIDIDSLISAGNTLKAEGLGISITISTKDAARTVIDSICDHINMVRYQDPQNGKVVYKLIRDDYDVETVVVLNQSNCSKISFSRLDWRETVSEICVTYTDRAAQYEQSSLTDNDPTVIELAEGNKVTKSYDMPYFTIAENALWAAKREAYQQGYPLATGSITGDRTLYSLRTGDVALLNWQPYGIDNLLVRVTDIDLGNFTEGEITVQFMEDMFSLGKTDYGFSGSTGWRTEDRFPTGAQDFRFLELPYELIPDHDTHVFAFAAKPNVNTVKWTVWRDKEPIGWSSTTSLTKWSTAGRLIYDYPEFSDQIDLIGMEVSNIYGIDLLRSSTLPSGLPDVEAARNGSKLLIIGDEIMAWSNAMQLPNGNWQLGGLIRGVYDTVPAVHHNGEVIFFFEPQSYANVTTGGPTCFQGFTSDEFYNITTTSVDNIAEEFDISKAQELESVRRAERPNPPGNVRMSCYRVAEDIHLDDVAGDVRFSWTPRNKEIQTFGIAAQSDATEHYSGQTFILPVGAHFLIRVHVGGVVVAQYTLTDNEFNYTWAKRCLDSHNIDDSTTFEITTVLNGLESLQSQHRTFNWEVPLMFDACVSEADIQQRLVNWGNANVLAAPDSPYSAGFQADYSRLNIFILGMQVSYGCVGSVLSWDGHSILPDGRIAIVTAQNTYEIVQMDVGYSFRAHYTPANTGGDEIYKYYIGGVDVG